MEQEPLEIKKSTILEKNIKNRESILNQKQIRGACLILKAKIGCRLQKRDLEILS